MSSVTLKHDDAALDRLSQRARLGKTSIEALATSLLGSGLEVERFEDGAIEAGCERLKAVMMKIPSASEWQWSGVDHRHWWVLFRLDEKGQYFGRIIGTLAHILNSDVLESWGSKPFAFTPELFNGQPCWNIQTLVSMVDPGEVAEHLENRLPAGYENGEAWNARLRR